MLNFKVVFYCTELTDGSVRVQTYAMHIIHRQKSSLLEQKVALANHLQKEVEETTSELEATTKELREKNAGWEVHTQEVIS